MGRIPKALSSASEEVREYDYELKGWGRAPSEKPETSVESSLSFDALR